MQNLFVCKNVYEMFIVIKKAQKSMIYWMKRERI